MGFCFSFPVSSIRPQEQTLNTLRDPYPSHSSVVPRHSTVIHAAPPGSTPYVTKDVTEQFIRQSSVENVLHTQNTSSAAVSRESAEGKARNISSGWYEILL